MDALFEDYLERLQGLHDGIREAIRTLPAEALDWSPGAEMNSIGVLAAHVAGSELYWIGDIAGQTPTGRVRELEFRTHGLDQDALQRLLDAALALARETLQNLNPQELDQVHSTPDGRTVTAGWALLHALEHAGLHTGHIQLTAQLWRQAAGGPGRSDGP